MADRVSWTARVERAWLERSWLSALLLPLAGLYFLLTTLRRWCFDRGWLHAIHLGVPTIVVGNVIAGGAGKTPAVLAIVETLRRRGFTPGIVSRGYGRSDNAVLEVQATTPAAQSGDEPLLLHLRSRAPVVVGRDRVAAGRWLRQRHPRVDVIVTDDGLQHRRLARDLQVIVFDERGIGNGRLLPAGPLREPLSAMVPPRSLVLYNATAPSTSWPGSLARRQLAGCVPLAAWWQGAPPEMTALHALRGRPVLAAAGLARPGRFFAMLRAQGLVIDTLALRDHHDFATLPWPPGTPDVIVTEKDAVKIDPARVGTTRVWVAALDFALDAPFEEALLAGLAGTSAFSPE